VDVLGDRGATARTADATLPKGGLGCRLGVGVAKEIVHAL
jgi:hypothetical protein